MLNVNYYQYLMGHGPESGPSQDDHSTLPVDSISADQVAVTSGPSARVIDSTSVVQSTASTSPIYSLQQIYSTPIAHILPLVDPTSPDRPMSPAPSTPRDMEYCFEAVRPWSSGCWPESFIDPASLATAGFHHTDQNDTVHCFECHLVNPQADDATPMHIHVKRSAECRFIRNEHCDNVPGQELYEISEEAPVEITDENPERSNNDNVSNETILLEELASLEEENRALKDARSCKVCTRREAVITFLPCGHLATCQYCAPAFRRCIICRKRITAINRIVLA